ncbi:uncharacterized protein MYCFIDRAFT_208476 [Pseudocercospora fijiensis CIRAD86]|uniref:Uncharacterized protein n=1 Tax=Pseudocercospora fijiensis (strain CIRAD86) TaxID=383855 RepID=M3ARP0_PSEFD|nr:uncharacterized protein MYCFIDRAFT_208476 [Pseudocercospora fijiensis CIRAD86]EME80107.1 hypothetical protein MYCFIDRAFT_208476 [Pseudocercospora fijiensis CIRAD86]
MKKEWYMDLLSGSPILSHASTSTSALFTASPPLALPRLAQAPLALTFLRATTQRHQPHASRTPAHLHLSTRTRTVADTCGHDTNLIAATALPHLTPTACRAPSTRSLDTTRTPTPTPTLHPHIRSIASTENHPRHARIPTLVLTSNPSEAARLRAQRPHICPIRRREHQAPLPPQLPPEGMYNLSITAPQPPSPPLGAQPAPPPPDGSEGPVSEATASTDVRSTMPPRKIKVRDLEHIQSFATDNMGSFSEIRSRSRSRSRGTEDDGPQYEISDMKVEHIIEMVAGLLTKITTTNDRQHEHLHRQPPNIDAASHLNPQTSSVLAFHGKNVPSITILSYLSRINKYCPTSYEVFLSLLVYFDRMTERVNAGPMQTLRELNQNAVHENAGNSSTESLGSDGMEGVTATTPSGTQQATPPHSGGNEKASGERGIPGTPHSRPNQPESPSISPTIDPYNLSHFFVVDSFNIHRLVIAGVTCASKFFSDIFYTNSRYAKVSAKLPSPCLHEVLSHCIPRLNASHPTMNRISLHHTPPQSSESDTGRTIRHKPVGGLPLPELNHLELQFLLLNDFRLSIPVEEIEAYGTMLVEFYAREVVAQQKAADAAREQQMMQARSLSESSNESTATVRAVGEMSVSMSMPNPGLNRRRDLTDEWDDGRIQPPFELRFCDLFRTTDGRTKTFAIEIHRTPIINKPH